jgi:RecA/RadA recombinase
MVKPKKEKATLPGLDYSNLENLRNSMMDRLQFKLSKKIKGSAFYKLNDPLVPTSIRRVVPSGLPAFDLICGRTPLGRCGLPIGRQMELFGPTSAGKTSLACLWASAYQNYFDWNVQWLETENKLDPKRAVTIGLDPEKVQFSQPSCLEDMIDTIDMSLDEMPERNNLPEEFKNFGTVFVVDSVAATPSRSEIEGDMEDNNIGVFQRKMSQAMRRITNKLSKRNATIIWINQERTKLNFGGKGGVATYGGKALPYYCTARWKIWSQLSPNKKGIVMHIENVKNQQGAHPYLKVDAYLDFQNGFDYVASWKHAMVQLYIGELVGNSIVMKEGTSAGLKLSNAKLRSMYEDQPEFFREYEKLMKEFITNYHELTKKEKGKDKKKGEDSGEEETAAE